jgi:hypothetical protein
VYGLLGVVLIGVFLFVLSWPSVRISHVTIYGSDQSLAILAERAMQGTYFFGIPRNSTFFVPESRIREILLTEHPDIAAISLFRSGLNGLSIKVDYRVPIARWCGVPLASTTPALLVSSEVVLAPDKACYLFDANGFLYAASSVAFVMPSITETSATSTSVASADAGANASDGTLTPYVIFDALKPGQEGIVGRSLSDAAHLPPIFDFARQIRMLGAEVKSIVLRGDEADLFLVNGLRITYLVGMEQHAADALFSARSDANPSDTTIQYIDLRFPGKVYVKRIPSIE